MTVVKWIVFFIVDSINLQSLITFSKEIEYETEKILGHYLDRQVLKLCFYLNKAYEKKNNLFKYCCVNSQIFKKHYFKNYF